MDSKIDSSKYIGQNEAFSLLKEGAEKMLEFRNEKNKARRENNRVLFNSADNSCRATQPKIIRLIGMMGLEFIKENREEISPLLKKIKYKGAFNAIKKVDEQNKILDNIVRHIDDIIRARANKTVIGQVPETCENDEKTAENEAIRLVNINRKWLIDYASTLGKKDVRLHKIARWLKNKDIFEALKVQVSNETEKAG